MLSGHSRRLSSFRDAITRITDTRVGFALLFAVLLTHVSACRRSDYDYQCIRDLGVQPPGVQARLTATFPAIGEPSKVASIVSSCGCLHVSVRANGRELRKCDSLQRGQPLEVELEFKPKPKYGASPMGD